MIRNLIFLLFLCFAVSLSAQEYDDYIGAGHSQGIVVNSSDNSFNSHALNTLNGLGMDAPKMEASRFLSQAAFGGNMEEIEDLVEQGYDAWIDEQMQLPRTEFLSTMNGIWDFIYNRYISLGYTDDDIFGPSGVTFNYTWLENTMTQPDVLRQKMAFELSQIFVISAESDLGGHADGLCSYYDLLMEHSFGNFEELLFDVATNMSMGFYLSHLNNPKADPENNIHPDENFAREIMQLFSIGIYEMNMDGSLKTDGDGQLIQTYDLNDIRELAKVFTGMGPGGITEMVDWTNEPYFGLGLYGGDLNVPMIMYEEWHEPGEKLMFGGEYTIPDGQSGMEDVEMAVNILFNHPNTAPFISRQLIQRFIKSNPTPAYIERVAEVFVNNGEGERGDMAAVLRAILMDDEARSCEAMEDPSNGRLMEPVLRYTHALKSVPLVGEETFNYWDNGYGRLNETGQWALHSPTVFNFFSPDYKIDDELYGPEFEILNTVTTAGYFNEANLWSGWGMIWDWLPDEAESPPNSGVYVDAFDDNRAYISEDWARSKVETPEDFEAFMNELDILLTRGQLTDEYRENIRSVYTYFLENHQWMDIALHTRHLLYFMMVSPDFVIFK